MEIVFTGGGTGGHIFPILAIAKEMRKIYDRQDLKMFYIGPKDDYSLELLNQENIIVKKILAGKLRRYFSFKNVIDIFKVPIGILQAFFYLFFLAPDLVVSKGSKVIALNIPDLKNKELKEATVIIEEYDLILGRITYTNHFSVPKDVVIAQTPEPGNVNSSSKKINLLVSKGPY